MSRCLLLLVLAFALAGALCAQTSTATLQGLVQDATSATVAEARVTVTNLKTGVVREVSTSQEGRYVFPFLLPGDYSLTVERTGFRRFTQANIKLNVQQILTLNVVLEVGDVATTVEVT